MGITVGGNCYIDITGADEYFSGRLYSDAWTGADQESKERSLIQATRVIDRLFLKGIKTDDKQTLAFPRYPDTDIPQAVKDACCEEALALLERGNSLRIQLQKEGVKSASIGSASEVFSGRPIRGLLSPEAKDLLRPWLGGSVTIS
jgi:hypothetical protein